MIPVPCPSCQKTYDLAALLVQLQNYTHHQGGDTVRGDPTPTNPSGVDFKVDCTCGQTFTIPAMPPFTREMTDQQMLTGFISMMQQSLTSFTPQGAPPAPPSSPPSPPRAPAPTIPSPVAAPKTSRKDKKKGKR
jgi:hypothetical protein